jgi:predicted  nucleic acid-binding Zn-ribbon protein
MKKIIIGGLLVLAFLVFGFIAVTVAQVPEGWREYVIRPGDCLTKIAVRVPGVNRNNFLWAAEEIAAVNGIQNPNFILAWTPLYIPESVEVLRKAVEANLIILREKRAAPPMVFYQTQPKASVAGFAVLKGIKKEIAGLTKEVRTGFANLAKVEELKKELATANKRFNEVTALLKESGNKLKAREKEINRLKKDLGKISGLMWLFLGGMIAGFIGFGIAAVSRDNYKDRTEELSEANERLNNRNEELEKEKGILQKKLEEVKELPAREVLQEKLEKVQKRLETIHQLSPFSLLERAGEKFQVVKWSREPEKDIYNPEVSLTLEEIAKEVGVRVIHLPCGREMDYVNIQAHLKKCKKRG